MSKYMDLNRLALTLSVLFAFLGFFALAHPTDVQFLNKWGTLGAEPGQFAAPEAVAVDADGRVFVADTNNSRVQVFDQNGVFLFEFGSSCELSSGNGCETEEGFGQFNLPEGIAVDNQSERVFVVDSSNDRVQVFDLAGEFLFAFGESGAESAQFALPIGVEVDEEGRIYVADLLNNRIQVFDESGGFLSQFGEEGEGDGQFALPVDIAIFGSDLYVTDNLNHRVQQFDLDGNFIRTWGSPCRLSTGDGCLDTSGESQFRSPFGIAVDAEGNVYVLDQGNHRVQIFDPAGDFLLQFGSPCTIFGGVDVDAGTGCQSEEGDGQFFRPKGIAIAPNGSIVIVDSDNHRVEVFEPVSSD